MPTAGQKKQVAVGTADEVCTAAVLDEQEGSPMMYDAEVR